ncbi:hypothetical protein FGIG_02961 [Fasciola gigantica]|uniref:Uncharacterized protein n=1 Tax=Fasciola gigantica TaxID=46835 RepID=A0A504Y528_FASGI|nr:hypothetical protein FGIG_02961 [Fasciola gigantica]
MAGVVQCQHGSKDINLNDIKSNVISNDSKCVLSQFAKNVILLQPSDHVRVLQTVLRNRYAEIIGFISTGKLLAMSSFSTLIV